MVPTLPVDRMSLSTPEDRLDALRALQREGVFSKPFRTASRPLSLPGCDTKTIRALGKAMLEFYRALDSLYFIAQDPVSPMAFAKAYLDLGKPDALLQFARAKRFRKDLPLVLRPDLLLTPSGPVLTEMDAVPGGLGILLELSRIFQSAGETSLWGGVQGILNGFASMILALDPDPKLAIVVSEESSDYFPEMEFLARCLSDGYFPTVCLRPNEIRFDEAGLFHQSPDGSGGRISIIYRFFELFDLANIPKMDILLYFIKGGKVRITPPIKPWLEEKMGLALWHSPRLRKHWEASLSVESVNLLDKMIPPTWILDPRPVPPSARIPGLRIGEKDLWDFCDLGTLTQKERHLIIKPSGFSPLAWGSRGIVIGHDVSEDEWQRELRNAFDLFPVTPYVLQPFLKTSPVPCSSWDPATGEPSRDDMRVRACPYYFVADGEVSMGGILVTACSMDKKIIHGMVDSILAPAAIPEN
ncbi:MAG: hypothetical protein ACYDAM_02175 [Leptospirales bacterium]